MHQNIDSIDPLRALNAAAAKYVIVGAYALAYHGRPRATKDVDVFVGSDSGAPLDDLRPADLATPGTFYILGRPPNQIDIITEIDGVTFDEAWRSRVPSTYGGVAVSYVGKAELIRNKRTAGRPQDVADIAYLESAEET